MTETDKSWRQRLGERIEDPVLLEDACKQLHVGPRALKRWASGEYKPRLNLLGSIVALFPWEEQEDVISSMQQEFEGVAIEIPAALSGGNAKEERLSATFYDEVLSARLQTPHQHRFFVMVHKVLLPMLESLGQGIFIGISQCQSDGERIVALRERVEYGTEPWTTNYMPARLMGLESLTGHAVHTGRMHVVQDRQKEHLLPLREEPYARSSVAVPLIWTGSPDRVAGCVSIHSSSRNYFSTDRIQVISRYARLISLAFSDTDFYPMTQIALQRMASNSRQEQLYRDFRWRVDQLMEAYQLSYEEAERRVWSQFAQEAARP